MKSNARPSFYFSAYPLKALNKEVSAQSSPNQSPYLKAILAGKTRTISRVRVLPMVNPYRSTVKPVTKESELPADVELTQREWFNNYE